MPEVQILMPAFQSTIPLEIPVVQPFKPATRNISKFKVSKIFDFSRKNFPIQEVNLTKLKHKHNYELPPESELDEDLLTQPLSRENYVDKFHTLLYYEEHKHKRVLEKK